MSPTIILPNRTPIVDYSVSGPYPPHGTVTVPVYTDAAAFASGIIGNYMSQRTTNAASRPIWTYVSNGAGGTQVQEYYKGVQARRMESGAGAARVNNGLEGISMMPVTDATGLGAGYINPSWRRVQRFEWTLAISGAGQPDDQTGVLLTALASGGFLASNFWPTAPSITFTGGFGIIGDGLGGWQWRSWGGGPPPNPIIETVSLAANVTDPEDWNNFAIEIRSASGDREARLQLFVNNALVLTRDWVNAPILFPLGPNVGFDDFKYVPIVQVGPLLAANVVCFGDWTFTMGRFLLDGTEVLT